MEQRKVSAIEPISRTKSLVERAYEHLEALIVDGSLLPGELLPPERTLGEMLGVSRTVVREAVRLLTARGLLDVRSGSGTFVRAVGPNILNDSVDLLLRANRLSPEQIYEVRSILEINAAGRAAENAGPDEIAAMEHETLILQRGELPAREYAQHDFMFHVHLAESTGNPLFLALVKSVSTITIRIMHQMYTARPPQGPPYGLTPTAQEHRAILECVKQHDVEGSREAMAKHMERALGRMREARYTNTSDRAIFPSESHKT
jgi:GntR family transcriptional regulator, transcriptional repressor for pyruvate dehydrogenase complex